MDKLEQSGTASQDENLQRGGETLWLRRWLRCLSTRGPAASGCLPGELQLAGATLHLPAFFARMSPCAVPLPRAGQSVTLWYRNCRELTLGLVLMILRVLDSYLCHLLRAAVPSPGVESGRECMPARPGTPLRTCVGGGWLLSSADHPSRNVPASGGPRKGNRPSEWS